MFSPWRLSPLERKGKQFAETLESGMGWELVSELCDLKASFFSDHLPYRTVEEYANQLKNVKTACGNSVKTKVRIVGFDRTTSTVCIFATFDGTHTSKGHVRTHSVYAAEMDFSSQRVKRLALVECSACSRRARENIFDNAFEELTSLNCIVSNTDKHRHDGASAESRRANRPQSFGAPTVSPKLFQKLKSQYKEYAEVLDGTCRCDLFRDSSSSSEESRRRRISQKGRDLLRRMSSSRGEDNAGPPPAPPQRRRKTIEEDEVAPPMAFSAPSSSKYSRKKKSVTLGEAFGRRGVPAPPSFSSGNRVRPESQQRHVVVRPKKKVPPPPPRKPKKKAPPPPSRKKKDTQRRTMVPPPRWGGGRKRLEEKKQILEDGNAFCRRSRGNSGELPPPPPTRRVFVDYKNECE